VSRVPEDETPVSCGVEKDIIQGPKGLDRFA